MAHSHRKLSIAFFMGKLSENKRKAVLQEAIDSLATVGYRATTISAVAQKCGIQPASLKRIYPTKESLFEAASEEISKPVVELCPSPGAINQNNLRCEMFRFALGMARKLGEPRKILWDRMLVKTADRFPRLVATYFECGPKKAQERLVLLLCDLQNRGILEVSNPEISAEIFAGMVLGFRHTHSLVWAHSPVTVDPEKVEASVDVFLRAHEYREVELADRTVA